MPADDPSHDSRGPRHKSQSVDLLSQLVQLHERISAVEVDNERARGTRAAVNENMSKLLTQLSVTVESHESQLDEFRKATLQIARIAQVLEGAFGQSGLVGQVTELRKEVGSYNDRLSRIEVKLISMSDSSDSPAPAAAGDGLKSTVISALVKVILALSALLGAAAIGSKFNTAVTAPVAADAAPHGK